MMNSAQSRRGPEAAAAQVRSGSGRLVDRLEVQAPPRAAWRYDATRISLARAARLFSKVLVEGSERLPSGPVVLCFSHQNWADPFYVFAAMPRRPRMAFFGPEQEDMRRGVRNRLMRWGGAVVPYKPGNRGLVPAMVRVNELIYAGVSVAIAGEGRIHSGEGVVLPLREGAAYIALRADVPLVPVAINGTSWLGFRRTVRVRVGLPLEMRPRIAGRPTSDEVAALTRCAHDALQQLVADFPDQPKPGPVGRRLTDLFNTWPEGPRPGVPPRAGAK